MGALPEREAPVVLSVSADDSAEGGRVSFPLFYAPPHDSRAFRIGHRSDGILRRIRVLRDC